MAATAQSDPGNAYHLSSELKRAFCMFDALNKSWLDLCLQTCVRCREKQRWRLVGYDAVRDGYALCDECYVDGVGWQS
jgi:hypothetical protein